MSPLKWLMDKWLAVGAWIKGLICGAPKCEAEFYEDPWETIHREPPADWRFEDFPPYYDDTDTAA